MSGRTPLIMDVDTGTDDAIAIAAALQCQDLLDIRGFTTVAGNVSEEKTATNTLNVLRYCGSLLPVARGAARPLVRELTEATSHGSSGLGDVRLPAAERAFHGRAVDLIREQAELHPGRLQILATGPLTNVAAALLAHPHLAELIDRITIMGGCLSGGNMTLASEFNMFVDPEAARVVFEAGVPLTMVGLDVTLQPVLPSGLTEKLREVPLPGAELVAQVLDFMVRGNEEFGLGDPNLHDVIALAAVVAPELFQFAEHYVHVDLGEGATRGATLPDIHHVTGRSANATVAVGIDAPSFWAWFTTLFYSTTIGSSKEK